jgi:hypothetical protein
MAIVAVWGTSSTIEGSGSSSVFLQLKRERAMSMAVGTVPPDFGPT